MYDDSFVTLYKVSARYGQMSLIPTDTVVFVVAIAGIRVVINAAGDDDGR